MVSIGRCRQTFRMFFYLLVVVVRLFLFVIFLSDRATIEFMNCPLCIYSLCVMHYWWNRFWKWTQQKMKNKLKRGGGGETHFSAVLHANRKDLESQSATIKWCVRIISTISLAFPIETIFSSLYLLFLSISPCICTLYHYYSEELPLEIDQFGVSTVRCLIASNSIFAVN